MLASQTLWRKFIVSHQSNFYFHTLPNKPRGAYFFFSLSLSFSIFVSYCLIWFRVNKQKYRAINLLFLRFDSLFFSNFYKYTHTQHKLNITPSSCDFVYSSYSELIMSTFYIVNKEFYNNSMLVCIILFCLVDGVICLRNDSIESYERIRASEWVSERTKCIAKVSEWVNVCSKWKTEIHSE